jgi:hypothetical protein
VIFFVIADHLQRVIPAQAGIQKQRFKHWIPASAGMTTKQLIFM